jgi:hypothetical protein
MPEGNTTAIVQHYLDALAGEAPAEPIVRALLDRAVGRLHHLCASLLPGAAAAAAGDLGQERPPLPSAGIRSLMSFDVQDR